MKSDLLIKEIYLEAFSDFGHYLMRSYFRAFLGSTSSLDFD